MTKLSDMSYKDLYKRLDMYLHLQMQNRGSLSPISKMKMDEVLEELKRRKEAQS